MVDWFKHFFRFPESHEGISDPFGDEFRVGEDDIFKEGMGSFHHHSPFAETSEMFKHFEDMFKHFETLFQNIGHEDFPLPSIEGFEDSHSEERQGKNLRDKMLKIPDSNSPNLDSDSSINKNKRFLFGGWTEEPKRDTELDEKVATQHLDQIVPEISPVRPSFLEKHLYNHSVSVRISSANGKLEEHRTVKDSEGNVNVTVRRSLGDQTHILTTKRDSSGQSEKREDFINMDEESLGDFENKWQAPRHLPLPGNEDPIRNPRNEVLQEKGSSYFDIIRRLFGRGSDCN